MLRAVAPEIALSLWAITGDEREPVAGGLPATGVIPFEDPSAYRRTGLRLHRLAVHAALLVFGPGTAGGPHGRHPQPGWTSSTAMAEQIAGLANLISVAPPARPGPVLIGR
jgi:hypothetical protein